MKNKIQLFILGISLVLLFAGIQMVSAEPSGYALRFDDVETDYVLVSDSESLRFEGGDFSVELWVNITTNSGDTLIKGLCAGYSEGFTLDLMLDNPIEENAWLYIDDGIKEIYVDYYFNDVSPFDKWYFLSGVKNGNTGKLFIDGNFVLDDTAILGSIDNTADLKFSKNGLMDNIKIYERALSDVEVAEHYAGIYNNETGLVGSWNFNEGTGNTALDNSGFENNGTIYGAVYEVIEGAPESGGVIILPESALASTTAYIGDLIGSIKGFLWLIIGIPLGFAVIKKTIILIPK